MAREPKVTPAPKPAEVPEAAVAAAEAGAAVALAPAAPDHAAGTDTPEGSSAEPQGDAGGVVVPDATGSGAEPPAAADPVEKLEALRIRALTPIEVDQVAIAPGEEAEVRLELVRDLLACGAAELAVD